MGRQDHNNNINNIINGDPTMVNSSIALLQERFRQLEKVKERREGKELLKLFSSSSSSSSSSMHFQASSSSSSSSRLVLPHNNHKPNLQYDHSLSLGLHMANNKQGGDDDDDYRSTMKYSSSNSSSLWSDQTASSSSSMSRNFDHSSDVDTSLHL